MGWFRCTSRARSLHTHSLSRTLPPSLLRAPAHTPSLKSTAVPPRRTQAAGVLGELGQCNDRIRSAAGGGTAGKKKRQSAATAGGGEGEDVTCVLVDLMVSLLARPSAVREWLDAHTHTHTYKNTHTHTHTHIQTHTVTISQHDLTCCSCW